MKTFQPKAKEIKRAKHVIDAQGQVLGRLASRIALLLTGKGKADYSPHLDSGDFVTVINAAKVELTGKKKLQKLYRRHSGYPGGFKEITFAQMNRERPEEVVRHAVAGMLPDNRLKKDRLARLKFENG